MKNKECYCCKQQTLINLHNNKKGIPERKVFRWCTNCGAIEVQKLRVPPKGKHIKEIVDSRWTYTNLGNKLKQGYLLCTCGDNK